MKKYDRINSYFNSTPKLLLKIAIIWFGAMTLLAVVLGITSPDISIWTLLGSLLYGGAVCGIFVYLHTCQDTLVNARIGKHMKKVYGMSKEEIEVALDQINTEMNNARYSDVMPKKKYCSFFITENWMIGTDGIMLLRANAVKLCNVTNIQKNYLVRRNKGGTYYYFVIEVTDVKNHVYRFYLRSEENRDRAYNFLMSLYSQNTN